MFSSSNEDMINPGVERPVIRTHQHWAVLLTVLLQTVGVLIATFLLSRLVHGMADGLWQLQLLIWLIALVAALRFAWKVLKWWNEIIIVTDKRLMVNSGILVKKSYIIPINRVTDMTFLRPLLGRVLNYGTLSVESAGRRHGLEKIEYLPEEVFREISHLL
jgi:membrane protein YdbS with pleckstrin-like domain